MAAICQTIFSNAFFKWKCLNLVKISLKFVSKGPLNDIPALVQIMAWRRPGDKPLSEPMMVRLPTHICVTRPQWVKQCFQMSKLLPTILQALGFYSLRRHRLIGIGILIINLRPSSDHLRFIIGIPIHVRQCFSVDTGPGLILPFKKVHVSVWFFNMGNLFQQGLVTTHLILVINRSKSQWWLS